VGNAFPGLHPELVGEGPPEQVEIILCPHEMPKVLKDMLNGQTLVVRVYDPALLNVHGNAVHDPEHAQVQADCIHHFIAVHTGFELAQFPRGIYEFNGMDQVRERGVIPTGAMTAGGDQPAEPDAFQNDVQWKCIAMFLQHVIDFLYCRAAFNYHAWMRII
jgi:hypothetical protein